MPGITALLPAYNELLRGSVVLRTLQFADRVVVIDDGSSDHTAEVAAIAGAEVLRHAKNEGKGAALKTGFESLNGDAVIVTIDTDGKQNTSLLLTQRLTNFTTGAQSPQSSEAVCL